MRNGSGGYVRGFQRLRFAAVAAAIALAISLTPSARAQSDPALASNVLQVFREKCATCHSPQAKKVKKFGTITNLPKLAANQKLIKPGDARIRSYGRPLRKATCRPTILRRALFPAQQKQIIKQWIDARTPTALSAADASGTEQISSASIDATADSISSDDAPERSAFGRRLARWLGKFHPMAVHFPIALLMAAAVAEALWLRTRHSWLTGVVRFCVVLGTLGAIGAALGWVNASFHTPSQLLTTHRWLGTIAVLWAIPLAAVCEAPGPTICSRPNSGLGRAFAAQLSNRPLRRRRPLRHRRPHGRRPGLRRGLPQVLTDVGI